MGEYADYRGEQVKIGTCENLYYLRHDQRHLISGYDFTPDEFRYRFPFPDEDQAEPGSADFGDFERGAEIPGYQLPADFSGHGSVQFSSPAGYVLSIACPEAGAPERGLGPVDVDGVKVHRNGWHGWPVVRQQRELHGVLMTVIACGACGAAWRLETLDDARPIADCYRAEALREEYRRELDGFGPANSPARQAFLTEIADRIEAGYTVDGVPVLGDYATAAEIMEREG